MLTALGIALSFRQVLGCSEMETKKSPSLRDSRKRVRDETTPKASSSKSQKSSETTGSESEIKKVIDRRRTISAHVPDQFCDPENPIKVKFQDISHAYFTIRGDIERTPCAKSSQLSKMLGVELFFKKEYLQVTGSIKDRGARYALMKLSKEQKKLGVITASAGNGNHALALCYHGKSLDVPVTVVMPVSSPLMKTTRCRSFGGQVLVEGVDMNEAKEIAIKIAKERRLVYINGYDHPDTIAGQGTLAMELIEQIPNIDAVITPVGGGGLLAGVAVALKYLQPSITVIGVESEASPNFQKACKAGKVFPPTAGGDDAMIGVNAFYTAKKYVDKMVTVSEDHISLAILRLIEYEKAVVEGAGAAGVAALLGNELPELKGKRVAIPLCGGNMDSTLLARYIERGLALDGRLLAIECCISDRPGGIAELSSIMAQTGASVKDILTERAWLKSDVFHVKVKVICETRDREHAEELEKILRNHYSEVTVNC